jgi:hypothetical protein
MSHFCVSKEISVTSSNRLYEQKKEPPLKSFFKIDKTKIIVFVVTSLIFISSILVSILYFLKNFPWGSSEPLKFYELISLILALVGSLPCLFVSIFLGLISNFLSLSVATTLNYIFCFVFSLVYWYALSCLIFWIWSLINKFFNSRKGK